MNKNEYDLSLPDWGPYGKEYVGVSHIADVEKGDRWDCFVMAGYNQRSVIGPYARIENRWHHWKTAPDLSSYTMRYELEWKDQVYLDVTYSGEGEGRYIDIECVNNTELPQSIDVFLAATLSRNPLRPAGVKVPEGGQWISATEYSDIILSGEPYRKKQTTDALMPGQWFQPGAISGQAIGATNFFLAVGDALSYHVDAGSGIADAVLLLRYHRWDDNTCRIRLEGFGVVKELDMILDGTPMTQVEIPLGNLEAGQHDFAVELIEGYGLLFEGFAVLPKGSIADFEVVPALQDDWPKIESKGDAIQLSYTGCEHQYSIESLSGTPMDVRRVTGDDVPTSYNIHCNDIAHQHFIEAGDRETVLITERAMPLEAGETKLLRFRVGLAGEAVKEVASFDGVFEEETAYSFGMECLAATALGNVVFPVHHRGGNVRHNSPGRRWDSLYSWDSGMIGIGFAAIDLERAKGNLNQYLLPEGDPFAAWVEHGTPLPIQAEVAREIWDQTKDEAWLAEVYPKLRGFYEWLAGRDRDSTTARLKSGLLHTWDYNYNSGGWDDYPPQWHLKNKAAERRQITPCVTTSFAIRFAKHMQVFGEVIGDAEAVERYTNDIVKWTQALELAWDAEAGYYAYLQHDDDDQPTGIYRHESGENFNCGLDGISPLVAGVLDTERTQKLLEKLFDPKELWTEWGATTVSQSAAYYNPAGYWNGAIWMPHNYVIWKALREQGLKAEARKLAEAVLGCWEREAQASYHSFEFFRANTGRGGGWHQFSALSTPLLAIYRGEYLQQQKGYQPEEASRIASSLGA